MTHHDPDVLALPDLEGMSTLSRFSDRFHLSER